ncbi:MAG: hypothetical protein IPM82_24480 [Saprospiraceae bacterium]|nr:hypothetical protein [Saprospiraceae bacterium]
MTTQSSMRPRWLHPIPTKQSPLDTSFARWRAKVAAFGRSKLSCLAYAQPVPTISRERPEAATLARLQAQLATSSAVFQWTDPAPAGRVPYSMDRRYSGH